MRCCSSALPIGLANEVMKTANFIYSRHPQETPRGATRGDENSQLHLLRIGWLVVRKSFKETKIAAKEEKIN